ncbi:MAG TPA: threonylcarbamoyl-AMP synthase [Clostridiales bacterium]|nr:L-threonylcarbamoyladenylate synthase [Clostridia bacterium]MDD4679632.1 L-threonylcarbamoyladenylate synthase [Clostridia bacterium]HCS75423.1 threonylcarbamoyl-AMP synthase [Clostridiales bacterium]
MRTRVIPIVDLKSQLQNIQEAADLIRSGDVVAFPTETVYGLGANALDAQAVKKIFEAKGRPGDNPLIVHIHNLSQWNSLVDSIPEKARILADAFWPGPLTIILKKSCKVSEQVTAGLDTVGVRMPSHPVALKLISQSGVPIAAPSANRSGLPSPTTAQHVLEDMDGRIPMILDGGASNVGLESTVLSLACTNPVILRPGGITVEMLRQLIGQVDVHNNVMEPLMEEQKPLSPGMKYEHYAPKAPVTIIRGNSINLTAFINKEAGRLEEEGKHVGILATNQTLAKCTHGVRLTLGDRDKPSELAYNLFARLREFNHLDVDEILAEGIDEKDEGLAVMNRMTRAAGFRIIDL